MPYEDARLIIREPIIEWPGGQARLTFGGDRTTFLDRAVLPSGATWAEQAVGKGKILLAAFPLELNDNLDAVGSVYRYALKVAGVTPAYVAVVNDPGILICPTQFPHATLYVITSESSRREVSFRDQRSNREFSAQIEPGRASLLLVGEDGAILASYNWTAH